MKFLMTLLLKLVFRIKVKGLENYHDLDKSGEPMLIIANHTSLLDGLLIGCFLPGKTSFMISEKHTNKWYQRFLLSFVEIFKVDFHSPFAAKKVIAELKKGSHCMIFPEGRITTTGSLMKVYEGTGLIATKANASILTIHIDGAEKSKFSYLDGSKMVFIKQLWFPKITLTILPAKKLDLPEGLKGTKKHAYFRNSVFTMLRDAKFHACVKSCSLFKALAEANKQYDAKAICVEDFNKVELSLKKILMGSYVLGRKLHKILGEEKRVGLLLPNVASMPVTFFALQAFNHTPALLNFTAGLGPMRSACETALLKTVITSRKFVKVFELQETIEALSENLRFIYLEDIKEGISLQDKLHALITKPSYMPGYKVDESEEAVVLFTSGSEGLPKGVVLSHKNINSNIEQISSMLMLLPGEQIFNALPTFHCFGLTAGTLWPILTGAKVFTYPSPLHYSTIPEMVYQSNAKLAFGTDTFFNGYAKKADPYDFYSLLGLVAGAEKLRPETRALYAEKFHTPIYEGYGITEASPVVSVNIPQKHKAGTVGQFVPAIEHRLEDVPGINDGGRLFIKGPNIMLGYLMPNNPGILLPLKDGWHDTGDIVTVDAEGFVTIKGRAKRFAKIAGEMISLTAVEAYINKAHPEGHHVVVSIKDDKKGEKLILITNDDSLSRHTVKEAANDASVPEIMIPKTVILVEEIPVLGTGKANYPEVQKIAERH